MTVYLYIIAFVLAYILGSIPAAVWIGKKFHGIDVREYGSHNAGTTNVIRVLGWKTGIPVLIIDVLKGTISASLPAIFRLAPPDSAILTNLQILTGLTAILGHIFPLFAGLRGGKGVATFFGVLIALQPLLTISCLGVFLVVLLISGIVSVSSMSAGLAFPLFLFLFFDTPSLLYKIFSIFVALALLITHRKNIGRLLRGEEARLINFSKKKTDGGEPEAESGKPQL
jgi:glycerol-3-phosphate acyltransferase PlsY